MTDLASPALTGVRERRNVNDLRPNRFNSALFPDSLSEGSIAQIAEDLERHGQRVPIEVTPSGEIIDGERRWRGATHLGWDRVEVVVVADLTDDEMLDRVVDACTASRQMSVREQANVFNAVCQRLKREAGRDAGRPDKTIPNGIIYLTPESIRDAAAKRAGFSSTTLATRAEAVFARGSDDLQARVRAGSLSISAAYDLLPKRPKARAVPEEDDVQQQPGDRATDDEPREPLVPGAAAAPPSEADSTDESESESEDVDVDVDDDSDDGGGAPAGLQLAPSPSLVANHSISHHMEQVRLYVASMAERDYDEASAWVDRLVKILKASLGERPGFDDANLDALLHLS